MHRTACPCSAIARSSCARRVARAGPRSSRVGEQRAIGRLPGAERRRSRGAGCGSPGRPKPLRHAAPVRAGTRLRAGSGGSQDERRRRWIPITIASSGSSSACPELDARSKARCVRRWPAAEDGRAVSSRGTRSINRTPARATPRPRRSFDRASRSRMSSVRIAPKTWEVQRQRTPKTAGAASRRSMSTASSTRSTPAVSSSDVAPPAHDAAEAQCRAMPAHR